MANLVSNTMIYAEEWATQLQARLSEPNKWKDICNVTYTDSRVFNNPYLTNPTVQVLTRSSPYAFAATTETNESITISTGRILPMFIDQADWAQSTFLSQMEMADRQAVLLNEAIETSLFLDYANQTLFDNTELGGAAGSITLSATNVDDVVTNIKRKIYQAGGQVLLDRNGGFVVWRPADFQLLEAFAMANGFMTADRALGGQVNPLGGFNYLGLTHYSSNLLSGGHILAGVKKVYGLGILRSTYGQIKVNTQDPGLASGVSVVSRVDYAVKAWNNTKTVLYNVTLL